MRNKQLMAVCDSLHAADLGAAAMLASDGDQFVQSAGITDHGAAVVAAAARWLDGPVWADRFAAAAGMLPGTGIRSGIPPQWAAWLGHRVHWRRFARTREFDAATIR